MSDTTSQLVDNPAAPSQSPTLPIDPSVPRRGCLFTAENAAEMGRRSAEARRQRDLAIEAARSAPVPATDDYVTERISRVRAHIVDTDLALSKARDPLDRERLSRALGVLQETERKLAGRPEPGSYKPVRPGREKAPDLVPQ